LPGSRLCGIADRKRKGKKKKKKRGTASLLHGRRHGCDGRAINANVPESVRKRGGGGEKRGKKKKKKKKMVHRK